jgi:ribonuclease I
MFNDDSSKIDRVEVAIRVLKQALEKLHEHDYSSAQIRVALARQVLEELQLGFDLHFQAEEMLEQLLKQSSK